MSIVVLMGLAICGCYWWVNTFVPLPLRSSSKKKCEAKKKCDEREIDAGADVGLGDCRVPFS
ncbi:hypothetical protein QQ045_029881 [Rhodiola kirilowii]